MKIGNSAFYLNIILFSLFTVLSLSTPWKPYIWEGLGDPYDYLRQAEMSVFSSEFYCPARETLENGHVHSPRPFTVPILYKLVGANPDLIIIMQKILMQLSAFLLAAVLMLFLKKLYIKIFITIALHFLTSWWHVSGWSLLLLSESPATSLFLLWTASLLYYLYRPNWQKLALHLLVLALFSFTRDNWPYLLLPFYALFTVLSHLKEKKFLKVSMFGLAVMLTIFFTQQAAADYGHRYRLPIMHNLIVRVMPNGVWWDWFAKAGMPQQQELKDEFWGIQPDDKRMFNLYNDIRFKPFFDWVDSKGKSAYMKFLITHPQYSLLRMEKKENLEKIIAHSLWYNGPSRGYTKVFDYVFPLFHWGWIFLVFPFLIFTYFKSGNWHFAFIFFLLIVFLIHTLVLYNADTFEVERHMFINQSIWHLICFLTIIFSVEYYTRIDR